jgi:hypothetical protein
VKFIGITEFVDLFYAYSRADQLLISFYKIPTMEDKRFAVLV